MLKSTYKIIAICMSLVMFMSIYASAAEMNERGKNILSDLVDMDRVYEYDLREAAEDSESVDTTEVIVHKNAVWAMLTLGLMDYQTGNVFEENKTIPFNEFASIFVKYSVGGQTGFEDAYMNYGESRPVTMGECVSYLLGALGYVDEFFTNQPNRTEISIASKIGILDGVKYSEEKHVTRGELAQLLYNCLEIPMITQTVFSENKQEYKKDENTTILSERFDMFSVTGTCTAQYGQDIYTDVYYDKELIGIDRGMYDAGIINNTDDLLGHRVLAFVREGKGKYYELEGITVDESDEAVCFDSDKLVDISSGKILYEEDGKEKSVNISKVERVVYKGRIHGVDKLYDSSVYGILGNFVVSKNQYGTADTVIINSYNDFVVKNVSEYTQRITFSEGQKFNNNNYIDFPDSDNVAIRIIRNGVPVAYTDLLPGDVISIMETANTGYINIIASDKKITGTVSTIADDIIEIGKDFFTISDNYNVTNTDGVRIYPEITVGLNGIFSITEDGRIVAYNTGSGYRYGYLRMVGEKGGALDKVYMARIFTTDGEWISYEFADKLTLDGEESVDSKTAYDTICANTEDTCYAIVRYETNPAKKIIFLDTAIDNPEEKSDISAIRKSDTWNNKFSWTVSSARIDLLYSKYWLTQQTVVFNVPLDKDKENQYTVLLKPQFVAESNGNLLLYSADDFFNVPVVESYEGSGSSGNSFFAMYITNIGIGLNKEGEEIYVIKGANAVSQSRWEESKLYTTSVMKENGLNCKVGDIIQYTASGNNLISYDTRVTAEEIEANIQKRPTPSQSPEYMFAEVVDVDSARGFIKASINGTEYVFYAQSAGIVESSTGEVHDASIGDYVKGDKVFMIGGTDYMRTLVIR